MSHRSSRGYSPLRAKRRQSDAKWRASVATCYDALKYVVPNVKHLSKRKISKALILQECEKHIQDLEDTIKYLLQNECEKKGRAMLWREGMCWSHCTLGKLRADFADKQRKVFHTSAHGRRCYNLLQDIKEEVFNMKADPRRIAFIRQFIGESDSLQGFTDSSDSEGHKAVTLHETIQTNHEGLSGSFLENESLCQTTEDVLSHSEAIPHDTWARKESGKSVTRFPLVCLQNKSRNQVRQQPQPHKRLVSLTEDEVDSALLTSCSEMGNGSGVTTLSTSLAHAPFCASDTVHVSAVSTPIPPAKSDDPTVMTSSSSLSSTLSLVVQNVVKRDPTARETPDVSKDETLIMKKDEMRKADLKIERVGGNVFVVANRGDYSCLLKALQSEKEQEVPSLEMPVKSNEIKRPRLTNWGNISGGESGIQSTSSHEMCKDSMEDVACCKQMTPQISRTNDSYKRYGHSATSIAIDRKVKASPPGAFSTPAHIDIADIKTETDSFNMPCTGGDPMFSFFSESEIENSTPLFCRMENDVLMKRPPKLGSARKKLNFGIQTHTTSHFLSPDRKTVPSPLISGFTPVKLPQIQNDSDNLLNSLASPWKILNSPFDSQTVPQSDLDRGSMVDLEDSLLCLETIDSIDMDDSIGSQVFYDSMCPVKTEISPSTGDIHVVPQLASGLSNGEFQLNETLNLPSSLFSPLKEADLKDCTDFDGFYFYYQQVSQKLVDKFGTHEISSPTIAAKVAHLWSRLPEQDKVTITTLASLEGRPDRTDVNGCGTLSQDLEDLDVKPLDPQEFIPSFV